MMKRKNSIVLLLILVAVAVLLTTGCQRLEPTGQTSDLELIICPETLGTKADALAQSLANGEKFKNLLVILVKDNGNDKTVYVDQRNFDGGTSSGVVRFRNVANGTYTVYAFANYSIDRTTNTSYWYNKEWEQIAPILANDNLELSVGTSEVQNKLVVLGNDSAVIASSVASLVAGTGAMLLTGKGTVSVSAAAVATPTTLALRRPFVRLSVEIHNPTGHPIFFDELSFGKFKPAKTYLLGKDLNPNGTPVIPASPNYEEFSASASELPATKWTTEVTTIYTTYIFENAAVKEGTEDEPYMMYGHVIMDPGETYEQDLYLGLGTKPTDPDPSDPPYKGNGSELKRIDPNTHVASLITSMRRNQDFKILVNVYYGSSSGDINIVVDNSTWATSIGGSHTYK